MRIDVIHRRDPDSACDHEIYVDGVRAFELDGVETEVWDFDPGAGYSMADFEEQKADAVAAAPEPLKARIAAIYDEMKSTYEKWSTD